MGVDLSITTAVGVILDEDGITAIRDAFNDEEADSYWGEEILNWVDAKYGYYRGGISHGTAGSYYQNNYNPEYLYLKRLTKHYSDYDMPAGILSGPTSVDQDGITSGEHNMLLNIAQALGTKNPVVKSFTAVLWY